MIDLREGRSVNAYEHPTDVKQRTEPRTAGDVFPHSGTHPVPRAEFSEGEFRAASAVQSRF